MAFLMAIGMFLGAQHAARYPNSLVGAVPERFSISPMRQFQTTCMPISSSPT